MGLHLSLQPPHAGYSDTLSRHLLPALDWPPLLLEVNLRGWHLLTGWSQLQRHLLLPTLPFPPLLFVTLLPTSPTDLVFVWLLFSGIVVFSLPP